MGLKVRPITMSDALAGKEILNQIIRIGGTTAAETEFTLAVFEQCYVEGPDIVACHVALNQGGQVAGFQRLGINPKLSKNCVDIASFARPSNPVRGVGRALFSVTRQVALTAGFHQINATIRADNVPGLGYYDKMGFQDYATAKAVPLMDGTPVDRISKRYDLIGEK